MENFNAKEYEEKLRIEAKVKKEIRDKEIHEWLIPLPLAAFCFIILIFLLERCV
jgi:hypothetical protein